MNLNPVPQAVQTLGQTQAPILANFTEIDAAFSVNHVGYNLPGHGKHMFVQFPQQAADPGTGATEVALVAKAGTVGTQLFFQPAGAAASVEFTYALNATTGWTRLPSGIYLQWITQVIDNNTLVTFPKPMTHTYNISLTSKQGGVSKTMYTILSEADGLNFRASSYTQNTGANQPTNTYIFVVGV